MSIVCNKFECIFYCVCLCICLYLGCWWTVCSTCGSGSGRLLANVYVRVGAVKLASVAAGEGAYGHSGGQRGDVWGVW